MDYCQNAGYELVAETAADEMCYNGNAVLGYRITLPRMRTLGAAADYAAFNAYYSDLGARLRNEARLELYPRAAENCAGEGFVPYSLTADYCATALTPWLCCVTVKVIRQTGGEPEQSRTAASWSVCDGRRLALWELFLPGCCPIMQLKEAGLRCGRRDFYIADGRLYSADGEACIPLARLCDCLRREVRCIGGRP